MFFKYRFQNFIIHLAVSAGMAILAVLLVFGVWYPSPLQDFLGVTGIFLMLLGIDVILGPVFTFIISKPNKKSLKFDLSVIVLLQLSAFVYGMTVVFEGRPVWIVFSGDRFEVVQAYEVEEGYLGNAPGSFNNLSWFGPQWVGAEVPRDAEARNELLLSSIAGGADLAQRPDLYVTYDEQRGQIIAKAHPIADLKNNNTASKFQQVEQAWPDADSYLPLFNRNKDREMTVLLNSATGDVVKIVDLNPW